MRNIGDVHDVHDAAHRNARLRDDIELSRKDFVAYEHKIFIAVHGMRACEPPGAIELVVIEPELADQLRFLRASALDAPADIENDQPIAPVREVGEALEHLIVVKKAANGHRPHGPFDLHSQRAFGLPAGHFLGIF